MVKKRWVLSFEPYNCFFYINVMFPTICNPNLNFLWLQRLSGNPLYGREWLIYPAYRGIRICLITPRRPPLPPPRPQRFCRGLWDRWGCGELPSAVLWVVGDGDYILKQQDAPGGDGDHGGGVDENHHLLVAPWANVMSCRVCPRLGEVLKNPYCRLSNDNQS